MEGWKVGSAASEDTVHDREIAALADIGYLESRHQRWECCLLSDDQLTSIGMLHERGVPIAGGTDALILGANPLEDIRNTRSLEPVTSEGRVVEGEALLREVG